MVKITILSFAFALLVSLLYFRKREKRPAIVVTKTLLSALFVYAAIRFPSPIEWYFRYILGGLIFCFLGDVLLALASAVAFRIGLVFFLIGHVGYSLGFFFIGTADWRIFFGVVPAVLSGAIVYGRLRPHLGSMYLSVMAYMVAISVMLIAATGVLLSSEWSIMGRLMILAGALLFYLSDLLVARNRFIREQYANRLIGLPMYYCAQFLIAFSLSIL